jgi:hypothetical protein
MKNAYLLLLSLCIYLLTLLLSCEIIETNDTADFYFPLKVGYYWKYAKTYSETTGDFDKEHFPDTITTRIIGSININNHTYFLIENYIMYIPWDTVLARNEDYRVFSYNPYTNKEVLIYNFKRDNDTLRITDYFKFYDGIGSYYYLKKSFSGEDVIFTWHFGNPDLLGNKTIENFNKRIGRMQIITNVLIGHRIYDLILTNVTNFKNKNGT